MMPNNYQRYFEPPSAEDLKILKDAHIKILYAAVGIKHESGVGPNRSMLSQYIAASLDKAIDGQRFRDGTGRSAVAIIAAVKNVDEPELMKAVSPVHIAETLRGVMRDRFSRNRSWIHGIFELARAVQDSEPLAEAFKTALGNTGADVGAEIAAYIGQLGHFTDGENVRRCRPASLLQLGGKNTVDFVLSAFNEPARHIPVRHGANPAPAGAQ